MQGKQVHDMFWFSRLTRYWIVLANPISKA
jgi:hypothetical protein